MIVLGIVAIVLAVVSIVFSGHVAIVYQRFNDQIKEWSERLDDSTNAAIQRAARQILRDFDQRIDEEKNKTNDSIEDE